MKTLAGMRRRYAPALIAADVSLLSAGDRKALEKIIQSARLIEDICLRQTWSGTVALREQLARDTSPLGKARLRYFNINGGPWSVLDEYEPFIKGVPKRPDHANFYPEDMTKAEFEAWVETLGPDERKKATGFYHVIRRDESGKLKAVPYSEEYRDLLEPAAGLLREAAELTDNESLRVFLRKRADAFLSNEYYDSDAAWMDLDSPIEVTIGPYEVYIDEMFNQKAAFQAYVTVRDHEHTAKLAQYGTFLQDVEDNLPIDPQYRNPKLGSDSPICVVNELLGTGNANHGPRTAAYNLPNDEQLISVKGSKRVMLKNVQEAKFQNVLVPIARIVMDPALLSEVSFEAFFDHILWHELLHGLGPHKITVEGVKTTVRARLKELYSAIEEAKADISALFAMQYLMDKGDLTAEAEKALYVTFLASAFRSVRFGITEAHGRGIALQFNYLVDEGGITFDPASGTFGLDIERFKAGVRNLTHDIMTLQAEGSYEAARALLDRFAVVRPEMQAALDRLSAVPIDIEAQHAPVDPA